MTLKGEAMECGKTSNVMSLLGGALLGATAMYLLDPETGRKRRENLAEHAGDYAGSASELLHDGWDKASAGARSVGHTVADKAADYGQRLSDLAADYSDKLSDHAKDASSSWADRAKDAGSSLSDAVDDLRTRGRKLFKRYRNRTSDAGIDAMDSASDYGSDLLGRARKLGGRISNRARIAAENVGSLTEERHSSPVLPVTLTAVGCVALGGALIYLMDPKSGRSRRAWLGDKASSLVRQTGQSFYKTGRQISNRASGLAAETRGKFAGEQPVSSEQLVQRIRSRIGHLVSDSRDMQVMCDANGTVTLTGRVIPEQSDELIALIESIPGVVLVINRLDSGTGSHGSNSGSAGVSQF
jgi:gas vesicle protein